MSRRELKVLASGYILDQINSVSIWEFDSPLTQITLLSVKAAGTREADQVTLKH